MLKLTILCGVPACGKSTYCAPYKTRHGAAVVLSSDEVRGLLGANESDQTVSRETFQLLEATCELLLWQGRDVIIDATNTTKRARAAFVRLGHKYGADVEAVVFEVPEAVAKARNAARERVVPDFVIERMLKQWEEPEQAIFDEETHAWLSGEFHKITKRPCGAAV